MVSSAGHLRDENFKDLKFSPPLFKKYGILLQRIDKIFSFYLKKNNEIKHNKLMKTS